MIPDLRRVLDPAYLVGIGEVSTDELRSMRAECADLENGVSFVRRVAQGRLDLIVAEGTRRSDGNGGDLSDLVASLPEVLSDGVRAPASGRMTDDIDPPDHVVGPLTEHLDSVVAQSVLSSLADMTAEDIAAAALALRHFEDDLSTSRRTLHSSIDSLNEELARRIASGEVIPSSS